MGFQVVRHPKGQTVCAEGSVVVIGNFDGVHRGHKQMLKTAVNLAEKEGLKAVLLTFEPHPKKVILDLKTSDRLTPFSDKAHLVSEQGVDVIYAKPFTKAFARTSVEDFVAQTLVQELNAKHIVVGEDFAFGKGRSGNVESLTELGKQHGFDVCVINDIPCDNGERYSSSRVREALKQGDFAHAKALLGHGQEFAVHLLEDDYCNLVSNISRYAPVKNGLYWARITYTHSVTGGGTSSIIPIVMNDNVVSIKPLETLPDIPEGRAVLEMIEEVKLDEKASCNH